MTQRDFGDGNLLTGASTATLPTRWEQTARCVIQSLTARVTVTAATLQATIAIKATDFDVKSGSEATFTGFTVASNPLPTGITYSNGVITINNAAIGTSEVVLTATAVPRWIGALYTYTSGGGTVAVNLALSGW